MCGIFAVAQEHNLWSTTELKMANDMLAHRGPDAGGYWQEEGLFLGHRRLSIIDLNTGAQPMLSHDERYVVTFNGEIYNYRELRTQLQEAGHVFKTLSDTEVILEAYRHWQNDCVQYLNGMFAFVLWDRHEKRLFAARDRLGIKPLCWTVYHNALLICSTIEPLLEIPTMRRQLNYEALRDLLVFDYVVTPRTILSNVAKLPPGHLLSWHPNCSEPHIEAYWKIPAVAADSTSYSREELVEQVEFLLEKAVQRQMVSDVPLGAFLSGGIDSSLLVAFMVRHSNQPVKTFSISFSGKQYDESSYAVEVAQALSTDHTVLAGENVNCEELLQIIGGLDEPFADPTFIPTVALSTMTRQQVTVALSGDGADEVFGGYPKYLQSENNQRNAWYPWLRPFKYFLHALPTRPRGARHLYHRTLTPQERIQFAWCHYGNYPVFRKDLQLVLSKSAYQQIKPAEFLEPWQTHAQQWGNTYTTDVLMRADLRTYLSENCLVKTDRASMLQSLEVRVPFLDELLLDFVLPLSSEVKIYNRQLKSLLLPIAQRLLPRSVWDRPKHGFTVPLANYLATGWLPFATEMLEWGSANLPLFNYNYLNRLIKINQQSQTVTRELWTPLVIMAWFYKHSGKVSL